MPSVLHVTHFEPPIHGEAVMAALLRDSAANWGGDTSYHTVDTVFARNRDQLGGLNLRKLVLLARFLVATTVAKFRFRADILLVHPCFHRGSFLKDSLFIWLGRLLRMKVIAWVHMDPARINLEHCPAWFRGYFLTTLDHVDHFVACAPSLPAGWPEWLNQHPHTGIANAIPDPLNGEYSATPKRSANERCRVIYLSAMHQEKGWQDLFQAACQICRLRSDVEFRFYGNVAPDEEPALRETFAGSGHAERIQWHGPVCGAEKFQCLRQADLFVFPSHTEQFPITILEAMACGLPVIATRVGAISDALREPEGGVLVEVGSPEALQDVTEALLNKPETLAGMASFNRERFLREFSVKTFDRCWHEFLRSV